MKINNISLLRSIGTITLCLIVLSAKSQDLSSGYEIRYFSNDENANGETDFKGETSVFSTDERINFLSYYANEVSAYHRDKELNTEVAPDIEVESLMASIKPQPLPGVRQRINLDEWKWLSTCSGQHESSLWQTNKYTGAKNLRIQEGALSFSGEAKWKWDFAIQTWRFTMSWKLRLSDRNCKAEFLLQNNATEKAFTKIGIEGGNLSYYSMGNKAGDVSLKMDEWHQIKIEANLDKEDDKQHYNLFIDGQLAGDFLLANEEVMQVNGFESKAAGNIEIDELFGVGYHRTAQTQQPYYPNTFIDENFDIKPEVKGWESKTYDDSSWPTASLPIGQGSERHKGEDLYLRKTVKLNDFKRAYLNIETLDPGGEIWVNGKMVALIKDRYPIHLDLSKYLKSNSENLITLKVNHFYLNPAEGTISPHSPLDYNANWFAGRAWLDLTGETFVHDAFLYTKSLKDGNAEIQTLLSLEHKGTLGFKGKIRIKAAPWNDIGDNLVQVAETPVLIGPGKKEIRINFTLNKPKLWEPDSPSLYKVVVEVENIDLEIIDDYVFTTGIRTLSQKGGTFHLNDKPAMLNGAQIMGFRAPLENMMSWIRCPPEKWVAKEMLMIQKMNCNMLRIHVHGWKDKAVGVNDPRYAEYADQMGIMLISASPAWIREGDWGQIDFDGYHKYMKQTQNHPSIVMWEASNHPNTFKNNPAYESDLFCEKAYNSIYPYDPSRLISITSHIAHVIYGNDEGTIDKGGRNLSNTAKQEELADPGNQIGLNAETFRDTLRGDKIQANKAWTAPMVTRGNQDALTGYGAQWSVLRKWPSAYYQGFLDSKERAYFNFEHQESIGQPNWYLSRGKPWYHLQSYEWAYDEGSIGRKLQQDEWRESQAWQAFSAYEAIKKMRKLDYDGFSWCTLHGGPNAATYKKPAIDFLGYGKLVFHVHKTIFQSILAGSNNVDVVYGPGDSITPMVLNLGEAKKVKLSVVVRDRFEGRVIDRKVYKDVPLEPGRTVIELEPFKPNIKNEGLYFIEYLVDEE
jgi:glycosyl hydrolase family 2